jgi:hypothetical protein
MVDQSGRLFSLPPSTPYGRVAADESETVEGGFVVTVTATEAEEDLADEE